MLSLEHPGGAEILIHADETHLTPLRRVLDVLHQERCQLSSSSSQSSAFLGSKSSEETRHPWVVRCHEGGPKGHSFQS